MIWLLVVVAVLVVAGTAALATAAGSGVDARVDRFAFGAPASSRAHQQLDPADFEVADLDGLILDRALRGYRMDEVDGVIAVLREQLAARDVVIAELRRTSAETARRTSAETAASPAPAATSSPVAPPAGE